MRLSGKAGREGVLDRLFIADHTHGFAEFEKSVRAHEWPELELGSGLDRSAMEAAARVYARAKAAIIGYGMGLTQHVNGVENVQMVANLLLCAAISASRARACCRYAVIRTCRASAPSASRKSPSSCPRTSWRSSMASQPPRTEGTELRRSGEAIVKGEVHAMFQLGGNLVRALPDLDRLLPAWRRLRLTVQIETKLNKSCLVHGEVSYILPCLGRIEIDRQNGEPQAVSVEDSTACIHGSRGYAEPASAELRFGTLDYRGARQGGAAAQSESRLGRVDRRLRPHPRRDRAHLSRHVQGLQQTHVAAGRLPSPARRLPTANGRPRPAKPTSSRRKVLPPTSRPIQSATIFFSSPPSAARASSTPPSIPIATASAAYTAPAWCCS